MIFTTGARNYFYFAMKIEYLFHWIGVESTAKFVLIVEKEAIFQRLLDGNIRDLLDSCIIITVYSINIARIAVFKLLELLSFSNNLIFY